MKILAFDESLKHRKIIAYNPHYKTVFAQLKLYVKEGFSDLKLIHVGSTAIPGISGKPMIDCIAATEDENLRLIQNQLLKIGFQKRSVWTDTDTKPYVCGTVNFNNHLFNVNIHVCNLNDENYESMIKFRDLLRKNLGFHNRYVQAKLKAHERFASDPEKYNEAKEEVILDILKDYR